LHIALSCLHRG